MPLVLQRVCRVCQKSFGGARLALPLSAQHQPTLRRRYARQAPARVVAQARKSALLREMSQAREEAQQDARDSQVPVGKQHQLMCCYVQCLHGYHYST